MTDRRPEPLELERWGDIVPIWQDAAKRALGRDGAISNGASTALGLLLQQACLDPQFWRELRDVLVQHDPDDVSDGFHTFQELYDHRIALTAALYARWPFESRWKSRVDHLGMVRLDRFLVGIHLPTGWVTYHVPERMWDVFGGPNLSRAPEWDGHTSADVRDRLVSYARAHASE